MNIARYRKAVYSALWLQAALVVCYLPLIIATALIHQRGMHLSSYLAWQFTITLVYINSSLNPFYLLLEDQRSEISCKRNIKATRPSMEQLVYYGLLCFLAINSFQTKTCFTKKILPEKKWTVLLESFFYTSEHCDTQSPYTSWVSKMGKAASRIYFTEEFQFSIQASGISRDSVTGLIYTD